jgi:DNA-binding MurR/RpiR family transcriptional regulator
MAFRVTDSGYRVHHAPELLHAELVADYALLKTPTAVASHHGVDRATVHRWCSILKSKGFSDPRLTVKPASQTKRPTR